MLAPERYCAVARNPAEPRECRRETVYHGDQQTLGWDVVSIRAIWLVAEPCPRLRIQVAACQSAFRRLADVIAITSISRRLEPIRPEALIASDMGLFKRQRG